LVSAFSNPARQSNLDVAAATASLQKSLLLTREKKSRSPTEELIGEQLCNSLARGCLNSSVTS
jgi:hypothetical protein